MIYVKNRVPAEVFPWHPQQRQLHGNTPTKQPKSRNFNVIKHYNVNTIWTVEATSYSEVTVNVQTAALLLDTRPETSSPFVDYLIDNGLLQSRTDLDQALLQLIHIFHRLLVYTWCCTPYTAPNAVVDRVEVEAVGRPMLRRDERWCLTTQKLNRRTCPTNGEDVSGPVSE